MTTPSSRFSAPAWPASAAGPRRDSLIFSGRIATQIAVLLDRLPRLGGDDGAGVARRDGPAMARRATATWPSMQVDVADEVGDPARVRRLVELARRRHLLEPAGVHHADAVGHRHRLFLVVGDDDEGGAEPALQLHQFELRALAQLLVERRQRLVEQQHLRPPRQRARQRHALPLAAGQLIGPPLLQTLELHQRHHLGDARVDLARAAVRRASGRRRCCRATLRCGNSA